MNKMFYSKAASNLFYVCLIALCVLLGILVFNQLTKDNSLPRRPDVVKLEKPATLHARVNDENVEIKVKKGAEIKILGMRSGQMTEPERVWVELEDGSRGFIHCLDFDLEYEAQLDGKKRLKPVTIKEAKENEVVVELKDGTTEEIHYDDLYPVWPKKWDFKYLDTSTYGSYISKSKFEDKYIGSTLEENDKRRWPARYIVNHKGTLYASYPVWVIDTSDGKRHLPTVIYDQEGVAQSYVNEDTKKRATLFVRLWPLLGPIMDNPLGNSLIEGSMYSAFPPAKGDTSLVMKILGFVLMAVYLVFVLLWLYATPMIPVLLIGVLMHWPKIFYPLSNKALSLVIMVLGVVSAYCWAALLLAWGIMWLFLIPLPFIVFAILSFFSMQLSENAPSSRCIKCRNIESMEFVDSVFDHEYQKWMRETEYVKNLKKFQEKWRTWTNVTTHYSDGSTRVSQENVQDHTKNYTTDLYDDYKVLYNVKVYKNNYSCAACGQHEHNFSEEYHEIDRKYLGTHQETHEE